MMTFKEYMIESKQGTYCGIKYAPNPEFQKWIKDNKIPNPINPEKLHTTVIFSRNPIEKQYQMNHQIISGNNFKPMKFEVFLTSTSKKRALVIILDAPKAVEYHNYFMNHGGTHDFADFKPHITVSYDLGDFDVKQLTLPDIIFDPVSVYTEPLDLDWNGD